MLPITKYKDNELNKFKKTNLIYAESDFDKYQDPTILGFKIFFHWDQKDSFLLNRSVATNKANDYVDNDDNPNSALAYLLRIKEFERAYYLKLFLETLYRLNRESPWYFQSVSGLAEAWKRPFDEIKYEQKELIIECLESVDLRVTAIMDYYRKACFDWPNRRGNNTKKT